MTDEIFDELKMREVCRVEFGGVNEFRFHRFVGGDKAVEFVDFVERRCWVEGLDI